MIEFLVIEDPALSESAASEKAKQYGLKYAGFGKYKDASGNVVAKTVDGKLKKIPGKGFKWNAQKKAGEEEPSAKAPKISKGEADRTIKTVEYDLETVNGEINQGLKDGLSTKQAQVKAGKKPKIKKLYKKYGAQDYKDFKHKASVVIQSMENVKSGQKPKGNVHQDKAKAGVKKAKKAKKAKGNNVDFSDIDAFNADFDKWVMSQYDKGVQAAKKAKAKEKGKAAADDILGAISQAKSKTKAKKSPQGKGGTTTIKLTEPIAGKKPKKQLAPPVNIQLGYGKKTDLGYKGRENRAKLQKVYEKFDEIEAAGDEPGFNPDKARQDYRELEKKYTAAVNLFYDKDDKSKIIDLNGSKYLNDIIDRHGIDPEDFRAGQEDEDYAQYVLDAIDDKLFSHVDVDKFEYVEDEYEDMCHNAYKNITPKTRELLKSAEEYAAKGSNVGDILYKFTGDGYMDVNGGTTTSLIIQSKSHSPEDLENDYRLQKARKMCKEPWNAKTQECKNLAAKPDKKDIEALHALSKATHKALIESGFVDENGMVTVFRGLNGYSQESGEDEKFVTSKYKGTAADSWTVSPRTVDDFSGGDAVLVAKVPLQFIVAAPWLHQGQDGLFQQGRGEKELIVDSRGLKKCVLGSGYIKAHQLLKKARSM